MRSFLRAVIGLVATTVVVRGASTATDKGLSSVVSQSGKTLQPTSTPHAEMAKKYSAIINSPYSQQQSEIVKERINHYELMISAPDKTTREKRNYVEETIRLADIERAKAPTSGLYMSALIARAQLATLVDQGERDSDPEVQNIDVSNVYEEAINIIDTLLQDLEQNAASDAKAIYLLYMQRAQFRFRYLRAIPALNYDIDGITAIVSDYDEAAKRGEKLGVPLTVGDTVMHDRAKAQLVTAHTLKRREMVYITAKKTSAVHAEAKSVPVKKKKSKKSSSKKPAPQYDSQQPSPKAATNIVATVIGALVTVAVTIGAYVWWQRPSRANPIPSVVAPENRRQRHAPLQQVDGRGDAANPDSVGSGVAARRLANEKTEAPGKPANRKPAKKQNEPNVKNVTPTTPTGTVMSPVSVSAAAANDNAQQPGSLLPSSANVMQPVTVTASPGAAPITPQRSIVGEIAPPAAIFALPAAEPEQIEGQVQVEGSRGEHGLAAQPGAVYMPPTVSSGLVVSSLAAPSYGGAVDTAPPMPLDTKHVRPVAARNILSPPILPVAISPPALNPVLEASVRLPAISAATPPMSFLSQSHSGAGGSSNQGFFRNHRGGHGRGGRRYNYSKRRAHNTGSGQTLDHSTTTASSNYPQQPKP